MEPKTVICIILMFACCCESITTIPFPPTMVRQPPQEQLFQVAQSQDEPDKAFMLECEANGNPEPEYRWTKNGEDFDFSTQDRISKKPQSGNLLVNKPEDDDEGLYQCYAENVHGVSVSNAVHLRRSELNSFAGEDPKEVYVVEGQPLSIKCDPPPSGYPKPTIFWIIRTNAGALQIINNSRIAVDPDGNVHFSNVTEWDALDEAHYACSATSLFRDEYKLGNKIILKVEPSGSTAPNTVAPTKQYTSPSNIVALRGKKLELSCIYGGTPVPEIKWSKKGGSLQDPRISTINFEKTLKIKNVDFQDEGTYECTATNGVGKPGSQAMAVTVEAAPFWINAPNNTNGAEDEDATFECIAGGIPQPKVEWFMNGVPIDNVEGNPRRKLDRSSNTLTIKSLEKSDTAVFQCNASNLHGYAFRDFYLNVLALPPTITERPDPITKSVETAVVTLRCRVFGAPNPQVKWEKNGQKLSGNRFHVLENGDLEITNVLEEDEGEYKCYATNKFGNAEAVGRLDVKAKTKITQPPENFEVAAQKSATFRCNADADASLTLTIIWLFNGRLIDSGSDPRMVQASDNSLTITETVEGDSGVYTCVAKTDLDQDEAAATLTVQDVPNPPKIIGV